MTYPDLAQGSEGRVPNRLIYSGGADLGVTKWLTIAADVLAQNVTVTMHRGFAS